MGHVVGQEEVSTDPDKIRAVIEWPRPTTVTEVRSFLGFVSYYRRFIPNFSKVAKPLNTISLIHFYRIWKAHLTRKRNLRLIGGLINRKLLKPCKSFALRLPYWLMQTSKLPLSFTLMPVVMD